MSYEMIRAEVYAGDFLKSFLNMGDLYSANILEIIYTRLIYHKCRKLLSNTEELECMA